MKTAFSHPVMSIICTNPVFRSRCLHSAALLRVPVVSGGHKRLAYSNDDKYMGNVKQAWRERASREPVGIWNRELSWRGGTRMAQAPKIIQCLLQRRIVCRFLRELLSYQKEKKVEAEKKKKNSTKNRVRKGREEREGSSARTGESE